MNRKGFGMVAILLVVAGLLVIAGGVWYYKAYINSTPPGINPPCCKTVTQASSTTIEYLNTDYGFSFLLPATWQGYSIVMTTWTSSPRPSESGPEISIRNPLWTSDNPYQDIPIMIFTTKQWDAVATGTISVSAAPFPPSELGRNTRYVFALPPRYNYAYPAGYEEVQSILESNPLHAIN